MACLLRGQQPLPRPSAEPQEQEPPEEDESLKPKEYTLNPLQASREITAGNFYFKKGNYTAAAKRYLEATRWDAGSEEAFRKLGETYEKAQNYTSARGAFAKFFDLSKDAKTIEAIKKRMEKWPARK